MSPTLTEEVLQGIHEIIKKHLAELERLGFEFRPRELDPLNLKACEEYARRLEDTLVVLRRTRESDPDMFQEIINVARDLRDVDVFLKM